MDWIAVANEKCLVSGSCCAKLSLRPGSVDAGWILKKNKVHVLELKIWSPFKLCLADGTHWSYCQTTECPFLRWRSSHNMREGWRSLTASTEDRRESMARALFCFLRMFLPWRGNDWIVGYGMVLWLPGGAVLFFGGNTPRKKRLHCGDLSPVKRRCSLCA